MKLRFLGLSGTNLNHSALSDATYLEGKVRYKKPDEPTANPTAPQLSVISEKLGEYQLQFAFSTRGHLKDNYIND